MANSNENSAKTERQGKVEVPTKTKTDIMDFRDLRNFFQYIIKKNKPSRRNSTKIHNETAGRLIVASYIMYFSGASVSSLLGITYQDLHLIDYISIKYYIKKKKIEKFYH